MSGGFQSPHFFPWMILHQHLMASSAMAANLNRLKTTQTYPEVDKKPENENKDNVEFEDEEDEEILNNNFVGSQNKNFDQSESPNHSDSESPPLS